MIILDIVDETVEALLCSDGEPAEFEFIHGSKGWMNLQADEAKERVAWLGYPLVGQDAHLKTAAVETTWPITLFLGEQSTISGQDTTDQIRAAVSRMFTYALQFQLRLLQDDRVKTVTAFVRNEVHSLTDRALAGCYLTCNVVTYNESSVCIE